MIINYIVNKIPKYAYKDYTRIALMKMTEIIIITRCYLFSFFDKFESSDLKVLQKDIRIK